MGKKKYDEKQLLDRGDAFRNAFVSFFIVSIIIYIVNVFSSINIGSDNSLLMTLSIPTSVYILSMILKNAYDGIEESHELLNISGLFGGGVGFLIIYLPDFIFGNKSIVVNSYLSENIGGLFVGILMIITSFIYFIKRQNAKMI